MRASLSSSHITITSILLILFLCINLNTTTPAFVSGASIISLISYIWVAAGPNCVDWNFIGQTNWTAGDCTPSSQSDTSSAYYCNSDGSYAYLATFTGTTCSGEPAELQRWQTHCGVVSRSAQYQCFDNTGPFLPDTFGTAWPPGDDWSLTTSYLNLTSNKRTTTCPSSTRGLSLLQTATRYGYCQRTSSNGTGVWDQSQYMTCSGSSQDTQMFAGTTCNSANLLEIEQKSGCSNGCSIQCGAVSGGDVPGQIMVGVKQIDYADGMCGGTAVEEEGIVKPGVCVNNRITSCVDRNGTTIVQQKRYSDSLCQTNSTGTYTFQQNVCTQDPDDRKKSFTVQCVTDGGGIGASASTICVPLFTLLTTFAITLIGVTKSF